MSKRRWWALAAWLYVIGLFLCLTLPSLGLQVAACLVFGWVYGSVATRSYHARFKRG